MHAYDLILTLTGGLSAALVLGYITQRLGLSPLVGYLLAGTLVGPHTPGFVADATLAEQLAEIGVILLMFGVGLQFHVEELLAVRRVAVPGAIAQSAAATALGALLGRAFGWQWTEGLVFGMALSVASTVVLARVLADNNDLHTPAGHIAVGWLVVEDLFTVVALVVLPALLGPSSAEMPLWAALGITAVKVTLLVAFTAVVGTRVIPRLLDHVAGTRSRELFTLTVLVIALGIAVGSSLVFSVSMALGAFLAGMVVGQSQYSLRAASDALPMRDAFAVLFFVSVGMLFDPHVVLNQPGLLFALLGVVLLAKPLTAFVIVWALRYSVRSALTLAVALAQIGEFSFLLANEATRHLVLAPEDQSLLVACAIVSITLNPLLFRTIDPLEKWLRSKPRLWRALSRRGEAGGAALNLEMRAGLAEAGPGDGQVTAIIVGYGPVGRTASSILKEFAIRPVVVDLNLDAIRTLAQSGQFAVYGDATRRDILEAAGIREAKYLLVTISEVLVRTVVILAAKDLNPDLRVFARARYLQERAWLEEVGATGVVTDEAETALGLAVLLLREVGADEERVRKEIRGIHNELRTLVSEEEDERQ